MKCCFECGRSDIEIHDHHVVPKSLGGTKTIPLCSVCHGKVHSLKGLESGHLSKLKIDERRKLGFYQGQVPFGFRLKAGKLVVDEEQDTWIKWMMEREAAGMTPSQITRALNVLEVPTVRGKPWRRKVVSEILKRMKIHGHHP